MYSLPDTIGHRHSVGQKDWDKLELRQTITQPSIATQNILNVSTVTEFIHAWICVNNVTEFIHTWICVNSVTEFIHTWICVNSH